MSARMDVGGIMAWCIERKYAMRLVGIKYGHEDRWAAIEAQTSSAVMVRHWVRDEPLRPEELASAKKYMTPEAVAELQQETYSLLVDNIQSVEERGRE